MYAHGELDLGVFLTSQSHGQTGMQVFVFICGTHLIYTNVQLINWHKINRLHS